MRSVLDPGVDTADCVVCLSLELSVFLRALPARRTTAACCIRVRLCVGSA